MWSGYKAFYLAQATNDKTTLLTLDSKAPQNRSTRNPLTSGRLGVGDGGGAGGGGGERAALATGLLRLFPGGLPQRAGLGGDGTGVGGSLERGGGMGLGLGLGRLRLGLV